MVKELNPYNIVVMGIRIDHIASSYSLYILYKSAILDLGGGTFWEEGIFEEILGGGTFRECGIFP